MKSNNDKFTIIKTSCDGASMEWLLRHELEKRLAENYYGDILEFSVLHGDRDRIDLEAQSGFWIIPGWPIAPEVKVVKTAVVLP